VTEGCVEVHVRGLALLCAVGVLLAACGRDATSPDSRDAQRADSRPGGRSVAPAEADVPAGPTTDSDTPPDVVVVGGRNELSLRPWTYCFGNTCADGFPPSPPPDIGSPAEVEIRFPLPDWDFSAIFQAAGSPCARRQSVQLERSGPTTARLRPVGRAGSYDVTLAGRGNGDLFVSFRWTTPRAGPMPVPEARLALVADHDGAVDSYGVELEVVNLAASPSSVDASITATASNGRSLSFAPSLPATPACGRTEGSIYWDGPDERGLAAAALGPAPFTYHVELVLDGVRHVADAAWPDDVIGGNEPSVELRFEPALPALHP
jgi:hypothetical protein